MTNAKRGRGSRHGVYLCAVAALGLALSACGGGSGSSSGSPAAAQSSQPAQSSASGATQSSTSSSAQGSTSAQGTGSGTTTGSTGSGSGSNPPTATAGTATINWTPPTENVDGSALTDLAGYHIHYGTASGNYTQTITVSNPGLTTYVVSNLTAGTYYFAVAAVNSSGIESPLSSEVTATVN